MALAPTASDASAIPVTAARRASLVVATVIALGSGLGAQRNALPFGLKPGRHPVTTRHGYWMPRDSGAYPVVILAGDWPAALDQTLARYLASHGFLVVRSPDTSARAVTPTAGDSTAVAVVQWSRDTTATALLDGASSLSIRVVRSPHPPNGRLRVALPRSGARPDAVARHNRLIGAVTQAILNATLKATQPLSALASRFTAAGLQGTYIRVP